MELGRIEAEAFAFADLALRIGAQACYEWRALSLQIEDHLGAERFAGFDFGFEVGGGAGVTQFDEPLPDEFWLGTE